MMKHVTKTNESKMVGVYMRINGLDETVLDG